MEYTKEYFIEKFSAIPDENWIESGDLQHPTKPNCGCALFHCGVRDNKDKRTYLPTDEAIALIKLFGGNDINDMPDYSAVYRVNDAASVKGITPKQAILNKLYSL